MPRNRFLRVVAWLFFLFNASLLAEGTAGFSETRQTCSLPLPEADLQTKSMIIRSMVDCKGQEEIHRFLMGQLAHTSIEIRKAAWFSLADDFTGKDLPLLLNLYYGNNFNASPGIDARDPELYEAMSHLAEPAFSGDLRPIFIRGIHSETDPVVLPSIEGLARLGNREDWITIRPLLQSSHPDILEAAILAGGELKARDAVSDIAPFLNHAEARFRILAIRSLAETDSPPALKLLIEKEKDRPKGAEARVLWQSIQSGMNRLFPGYEPALTTSPARLYDAPALSSRVSHLIGSDNGLFVQKTENREFYPAITSTGLRGYVHRNGILLFSENKNY